MGDAVGAGKVLDRKGVARPECSAASMRRIFVIHEHHARQLHFDLRLEMEGVLKSWAVPKGVPEAGDVRKRLAIRVDDHDIGYALFEGTIPEGSYGAGTVKIWDKGEYDALEWSEGKIVFAARGERMRGRYILVKTAGGRGDQWLIFRSGD